MTVRDPLISWSTIRLNFSLIVEVSAYSQGELL